MAAASPIQKNLDQYLTDVANFIDIKPNDYKKAKAIFESVFKQLKTKMEDKCNYFKAYSTEVLYAGSVYDKIKITKLDEFDMDIVIKLPVNYEEIEFENYAPGFVCMKITELERLKHQKNWELRHKVTSFWRDNEHYFLQNKFRDWIHSVVEKALGDLNYRVTVGDVTYMVAHRESGPASTFNIRNLEGDEEFTLDVDLVPVIRFMRPRWPPGMYRSPREQDTFDWLVVPKPNKSLPDGEMRNRCWRLSFQDYERNMMKGCYQLKPTIRLVKKLRDSLKMKSIASYYIKTLFLWKIDATKEKKYWQKGLSVTFRIMVEELYNAVQRKSIPYFWNEECNLIVNVKHTVLDTYADDLKKVIVSIDYNDVDRVLSYLLKNDELQEFKKSEFYEKQPRRSCQGSTSLLATVSECQDRNVIKKAVSLSVVKSEMITIINSLSKYNPNTLTNTDKDSENGAVGVLKSLDVKMDSINQNLENQNMRLRNLELAVGVKRDESDNNIDKVVLICERLTNLEVAMNYKDKDKNPEAGNAAFGTLQIDRNHTWSDQIAECSTSKATMCKDENDTLISQLDGYNERLRKLEESINNSECKFDDVDLAPTEVLENDDKATDNNENAKSLEQFKGKVYLNCDRPNEGIGMPNPLHMLLDPFNIWLPRRY